MGGIPSKLREDDNENEDIYHPIEDAWNGFPDDEIYSESLNISSDDIYLSYLCLNICRFSYCTGDDNPKEVDIGKTWIEKIQIDEYKSWFSPAGILEDTVADDLLDKVLDAEAQKKVDALTNGALAVSGVISNISSTITKPTLVVCFRGTKGLSDAYADLNIALDKEFISSKGTNIGIVAKGVLEQYECIKNTQNGLIPYLIEKYNQLEEKTIIICGHSLGGAMATLLAVELVVDYPFVNVVIVTFGAARVLSESLAKTLPTKVKKYLRFLNDTDAVPVMGDYVNETLVHTGEPFVYRVSHAKFFSVKEEHQFDFIPVLKSRVKELIHVTRFIKQGAGPHLFETKNGYYESFQTCPNFKQVLDNAPVEVKKRFDNFPLVKPEIL